MSNNKFLTKRQISDILGYSRATVDSEINKILSDPAAARELGEYRKKFGYSPKQVEVLKKHSVIFENL